MIRKLLVSLNPLLSGSVFLTEHMIGKDEKGKIVSQSPP